MPSNDLLKDYDSHAKTCCWLIQDKGRTFTFSVKCIAKKHGLVQKTLKDKVREMLPVGFLEQRKRDAQNNFSPALLIDECRPKT